METIRRSFRRNMDGPWTCIAPVILDWPHSPICVSKGSTFAPGTRVEGLDIAAWIEEQASKTVWHDKPWQSPH
jgi:hypothetical protein